MSSLTLCLDACLKYGTTNEDIAKKAEPKRRSNIIALNPRVKPKAMAKEVIMIELDVIRRIGSIILSEILPIFAMI